MKKLFATTSIILGIIVGSYAQISPNDFVFKVNTLNEGESGTLTFEIPTHPDETYNYDVDWNNDGVWDDQNITGNITNLWLFTGIKTIRIRGVFPAIYFLDAADPLRMVSIEQWGNNPWARMDYAFHLCRRLKLNATDNPNLSNVSIMNSMFSFCDDLIGNGMEDWDVSNVNSMIGMFLATQNFNYDVSAWNMTNVTDISDMFSAAASFNQNINDWDVSNVTEMARIFFNAPVFDQPLDNWDVSSATHMGGMFAHSDVFNQDISHWDTGSAWDMHGMFESNSIFNQDITGWDVGNAYNMFRMFKDAMSFNQNIGNWNVSSVGIMDEIFDNVPLHTSVYDAILLGWAAQDLQNEVIFDAPLCKYCNGNIARQVLANDFGWVITDAGLECPFAVTLNVKVFLEGAYSPLSNLMYDVLRFNGHIPITEPYSSLGYSYVGGYAFSQTFQTYLDVVGPDAIVDWLFMEFRDPLDNDQIIFTLPVLLQRDGDVVTFFGNQDITITGLEISILTIAIRHRNHLGVRSLGTVANNGVYTIDFTDPTFKIYGTESRKTIGSNSYMFSGDPSGDGTINAIDKNLFWRDQNGQPYSYLNSSADMNLDGSVNVSDKNNTWRPNNGISDQLD